MRTITLRGELFYVHDNEDLSNAMVRDNAYFEDHILDYIYNLYPIQKTIVDIGANIGNHTQYFARFFEHKSILAFEPIQSNFELLVKNTERYPTITPYNSALSNYTGRLLMEKHTSNWGMHGAKSLTNGEKSENDEEVSCITLDSLDIQDVTLIKIDVEHYEPQVLEGATKTIERCHPIIIIEDAYKEYNPLLQMLGYTQITGWEIDFTYLYTWVA